MEFQGEGKLRNDSAISDLQWCGIPAADVWTLQSLIYCISSVRSKHPSLLVQKSGV
jgi:hypothetical protein